MKEQSRRRVIKRIMWASLGLLVVLVMFLASAFYQAWQTNQALEEKVDVLAPMLTAAVEEQVTLRAELEYVKSDEYVERWAREHAGMTQPGETLVIPVMPTATPTPIPTATPVPSPTAIPTPTPASFWQRWWQALRGD
mgnify:CR=1 FL=1